MSRYKRNIRIIFMAIAAILLFGVNYSHASPVTVEVGADTPAVISGRTHTVRARVLLKPVVPAGNRAPIAVALVIDKSGSMQEDGKIENAKRGALEALKMLDARDIAAVVVYDTKPAVLIKARAVNETALFAKSISRIKAGGNTALYDGVRIGAGEIERFLESGYVPRIILLSDGLANVGPSSVRELASLGRSLSGRGITITTIGLGLDYDEDLMTAVAAASGGNSYFARTRDRLEDIFRRDIQDAVALTCRDVRITLSCEGDFLPIRSMGRESTATDKDAKEIVVDIGNLYGAEKYAIFEFEAPAVEAARVMKACVIRVEYTDAVTGAAVKMESGFDIEYTESEDYVRSLRDAEIATQAELARNAEILEQAITLSDAGRVAEASAVLRERGEYLSRAEYDAAAPVQKDIVYFDALAEDISREGGMSNVNRKSSVNQAYTTKNQQSEVERGSRTRDAIEE